ncbi:MAG: phage tail protein [Candidatus Helarchaeota archaeon]
MSEQIIDYNTSMKSFFEEMYPFGSNIDPIQDMLATINETLHEILDALGGPNKEGKTEGLGVDNKTEKGLKGLKGVFASMKGALGPILALTGALQAMGILEPLFDIFNSFMEILGMAFMPLVDPLMNFLEKLLPVFEDLSPALEEVVQTIADNLEPILDELIPLFYSLTDVIIMLLPYLPGLIDFLFELMKQTSLLIPTIQTLTEIFNWFASLNLSAVGDFFRNMGDWVVEGIEDVKEFFRGLMSRILEWIKEGLDVASDWAEDIWDAIWEKISEAISGGD